MMDCVLRTLPPQAMSLLWAALPSRMAANQIIWEVGLLLQCALVFAAFRRSIARRFPAFTVLIVFYPVRAGLLFALARRMDSDSYHSLYNALTLLEFPLQALVAAELAGRLLGDSAERAWKRIWKRIPALLAFFTVVCGLTWIALSVIAERQLADRVQVFMSILMLALFVVIWRSSRSSNLTCISAGFAAFAAMQLIALAGKAQAMMRHDADRYVGWSYVPALGYLAVVIFWLVSLQRESAKGIKQPA